MGMERGNGKRATLGGRSDGESLGAWMRDVGSEMRRVEIGF